MSEFTLKFQNSTEDYLGYCQKIVKSCRRRNLPLWRRYTPILVAWILLVGFFATLELQGVGDGTTATVGAALVSVWIFRQLLARQCFASTKPYADGNFASKWTHEYSEDGLRAEAPSEVTQYKWSAFKHLEELDSDFFLYVDNSAAIKIPKSAFSSEEEAGRWREFCEKHIAAAHA